MQHLKRLYLLKAKKVIFIIFILLLTFILGKTYLAADKVMKSTGVSPGFLFRLAFDTGAMLKSTDNRTNILLMGIGGGNHEGPDLTDTMLVMSINQANNSMALISVPRDIWSDTLKDKVNSAYHYGEEKKKGGGMTLAKAIIEDVVGVPIHYAVVIDFSQFQKVIDLVGGIDINVPVAFTDNQFPIAGRENDPCDGDPNFACRYQTIHFDKGLQHMSGERALDYVRSRHAEGEEGTDFARNRRQQDLMVALKQKLVKPSIWLPPDKGIALFHALDDATDTDMTLGEFITVGRLFEQTKQANIAKISFDNLLTTAPAYLYNGLYALIPADSFDAIHSYIKKQLK